MGRRNEKGSAHGPISAEGETQRHYLGEAPTLNKEAGLTALAAAKAYNNGRGLWPTQALQNGFLLWKRF